LTVESLLAYGILWRGGSLRNAWDPVDAFYGAQRRRRAIRRRRRITAWSHRRV